MSMFCYQCEQTAKGTGCTIAGVCGKDATTANVQDALIHGLKGLAMYAHRARALGVVDHEVDVFTVEVLFTTVTNVNFDAAKLTAMAMRLAALTARMKGLYETAYGKANGASPAALGGPASWTPAEAEAALAAQGETVGVPALTERFGADVAGLVSLVVFGLKGVAAYADHAMILGVEDDGVYGFFHEALSYLGDEEFTLDGLLGLSLRVGEVNLKVMEMLDTANTGAYGTPEPTRVRMSPLKGKAIVVSGHDLKDLYALLEQTAGKGINVYTHGEMLPAHAYPKLKAFPHLVGNYGGAWQNQQAEFDALPGAVLMTTNCIQKPKEAYRGRIFATGLVGFPGVQHVGGGDFSAVIEAALAAPGFAEDSTDDKHTTVGFGHGTVLSVADTVIDAVKNGAIRHFFLIGGCDGAKPGRNYYTEFAEKTPKDTVILTLACGKYRFNTLDLGEIGGLPRLMDMGQCNDAYSAIKVAGALAEAFGVGVNDLPLSMVLSWYEQKAVCILLTLLFLGIKDIRLGPTLPAFITPAALAILVEKFAIKPTTTVDEDLKAILG